MGLKSTAELIRYGLEHGLGGVPGLRIRTSETPSRNFLHNSQNEMLPPWAPSPNNNRPRITATPHERRNHHENPETTARRERRVRRFRWAPDDSVFTALELMARNDIGALLVMRDDNLRRHIQRARLCAQGDPARQVLQGNCGQGDHDREGAVCPARADCRQAMALMTDKHFRHLPVLDTAKKVLGMVSIGDLVKETISEQAVPDPATRAVHRQLRPVERHGRQRRARNARSRCRHAWSNCASSIATSTRPSTA
jgi:CBS domain-containing protein